MENTAVNNVQTQINEQNVILSELQQLKKNTKVYRQQQNSSILFLSSVEREMALAKKELDRLQKDYKNVEEIPAVEKEDS